MSDLFGIKPIQRDNQPGYDWIIVVNMPDGTQEPLAKFAVRHSDCGEAGESLAQLEYAFNEARKMVTR